MSNGFSPHGVDLFGEPIQKPAASVLAQRYLVPPFSVLNAREGEWQDRKRAWIGLGIKSELGRGANTLGLSEKCEEYRNGDGAYNKSAPGGSAMPAANYANRERGSGSGSGSAINGTSANGLAKTYNSGSPGSLGREYTGRGRRPHVGGSLSEPSGREPGVDYTGGDAWVASENDSGTSIFDPVVCELAYSWFCPPNGQVVDPFAGGSVRGIVASLMGRRYWGGELRAEQVSANREQAAAICTEPPPEWVVGDSLETLEDAPLADFVFSCPPYGDLERYSDDPRDLSTMEYHTFIANYKRIILKAAQALKPNRFACFVVGDFRHPRTGTYRCFVQDTITGFRDAGLFLYNEAILVTAVGSLPIRVGGQFEASRKLGKTHQNVLVFVKGDPSVAAKLMQRVSADAN